MSYDASRDYAGDNGTVKCQCGAEHPPSYLLTKCGHDGCTTLTCYRCAIICAGCGATPRCEDHAYATTYRGALKKVVVVCSGCRNESEAEESAETEAQVE